MSNKEFEIEIGVGLGEFKFGITRDALKKSVGKPDEIESNDEGIEAEGVDEEGEIEVWHYDEFELSVEFIEGNDWRLSTIAVNSDECLLESVPIIGKSISEIENLIDLLDLGEYESENLDLDDEEAITLLNVFETGLTFWFEKNILTEIQITPIFE